MESVLITGGSRGLGQALYNAFNERDYKVITCDTKTGDLTSISSIHLLGAVAVYDGVGILINNAGVYLNKPIDEMLDYEIEDVVRINLLAPILLTKYVWKSFKDRGEGLVVNINSLAGSVGSAGETVYAATKHGLAGFSKALQFDGTRDNVRVVNVNFGAMQTDMTAGRPDRDKFISPFEAAELIVGLCKNYRTLRLTDITVARRIY